MIKLSKATWGWFLLGLPLVTLLLQANCEYRYYQKCVDHWLGEDFVSYTGLCTEVSYGMQLSSKYTALWDFLDRDSSPPSIHIIMDNGTEYIIPSKLADIEPLCRDTSLFDLEAQEVTVCGTPSTSLFAHPILVSISSDNRTYLHSDTTYSYLQNQSVKTENWFFGILLMLHTIILGILVYSDISDFLIEKRRRQQKEAKIQRLMADDKLHPTKQLQKKKKSN